MSSRGKTLRRVVWAALCLIVALGPSVAEAAVPTFFGAGAAAEDASGLQALTPALPASTQANDIAFVVAFCNTGNTITTASAGWSAAIDSGTSGGSFSYAIFWKRLAGGDANPQIDFSAVSSGTSVIVARTYVYRGVRTTGNPWDTYAPSGPTNSATQSTAEITTTGTDRLMIALVGVDDDTGYTTSPPPASWSLSGTNFTTTGGADARIMAIELAQATAATVSAVTIAITSVSELYVAFCFDLVPPAAAGAWPQGSQQLLMRSGQ